MPLELCLYGATRRPVEFLNGVIHVLAHFSNVCFPDCDGVGPAHSPRLFGDD
jgi:hypothetical protein